MGQSIKVTTKKADSPYVHELALVAAELEQRYKESKVSGCFFHPKLGLMLTVDTCWLFTGLMLLLLYFRLHLTCLY